MAGLHLTRTEENVAEIDALAAALAADGGGRVGIDGMVPDLAGRLRRTWAPSPRLLGRKVTAAYTWDAHDRRDPAWMPQGITTSAETGFRARHGRDVLATSWYSKQGSGSRISVVDVERRRYGHVLLVTPTVKNGVPGLSPLKVHAGGDRVARRLPARRRNRQGALHLPVGGPAAGARRLVVRDLGAPVRPAGPVHLQGRERRGRLPAPVLLLHHRPQP
ncbi:hypothetical protein G5V59_10705 [Nocardioides sp. W3-2-3]|uniref:hypothetical protein n=1 Tax=Nocardioides convexus TaxID=2712224 RepID=UPI0024185025|nr:hypothetical protein [Nocardioides convexus]NHA00400.1 hypothetical protein [Nocardioides convexus]